MPGAMSQPIDEEEPERSRPVIGFRTVCAAVLVIAAVLCLWRSRETVLYLAHTREGMFHVLQESMAALLYANHSGSQPIVSVDTDAQQDAYFARTTESTHGDPTLGLVLAEASLPEAAVRLPKAFDFPLPTPRLMHSDLPPMHVERAQVPESLRGAAPIGPPVVAMAGPAQIMPVSTPVPQIPQFGEPVHLSEEAARAMLVHSVDPVYPPEAVAQKLQGPVVLQAMIGRDGSVEDLKIVRGYFVLGRAAIAAVKQLAVPTVQRQRAPGRDADRPNRQFQPSIRLACWWSAGHPRPAERASPVPPSKTIHELISICGRVLPDSRWEDWRRWIFSSSPEQRAVISPPE